MCVCGICMVNTREKRTIVVQQYPGNGGVVQSVTPDHQSAHWVEWVNNFMAHQLRIQEKDAGSLWFYNVQVREVPVGSRVEWMKIVSDLCNCSIWP